MRRNSSKSGTNQHLREARLHHNWSQQQVADRLGTTTNNVSRWELGQTTPGPYFCSKLCELFDKSPQALGFHLPKPDSDHEPGQQEALTPQRGFPTMWNVPFRRNPFFTGRDEVLRSLYDTFHGDTSTAFTHTQAISGLGGMGKTQTAAEYAYRFHTSYQTVLWIRAETSDLLFADMVSIATLLDVPEKTAQDRQQIIEGVKRWLASHGNWLLIMDNVENLASIQEILPFHERGHIILTIRAQATGTTAKRMHLERMLPKEGALFLLRRAKIIAPDALLNDAMLTEQQEAQHISSLLDGLPLALDQAGAYIEETGGKLSDFVSRYHAQSSQLLSFQSEGNRSHPLSVHTILSLAFEKVQQRNHAAAEFLQLCSFLQPDAIPEGIIVEAAINFGSQLSIIATDSYAWDIILATLRMYSLINRTADTKTFSIHRLVQVVLKDLMDEDTKSLWAVRAVQAVSHFFPNIKELVAWEHCQQCLPQANVCVELIDQYGISTEEAGRLLYKTGIYLIELSRFTLAEPLLKKSYGILTSIPDPEYLDIANVLNALGNLYVCVGKYYLAESFFRQALEVLQEHFGSEHPNFSENMNDLAILARKLERYEQAEELYVQALHIREKVFGPTHLMVAESLYNLAVLYRYQKKYKQAEYLFQRVLDTLKELLDAQNPTIATVMNELAMVYFEQGNYPQAQPFLEYALALREEIFAAEHLSVAMSLNNLARLYHAQYNYSQAEPFFQRALTIYEKIVETSHIDMANVLENLAKLYIDQGKEHQASPLLERASVIREKALGQIHYH